MRIKYLAAAAFVATAASPLAHATQARLCSAPAAPCDRPAEGAVSLVLDGAPARVIVDPREDGAVKRAAQSLSEDLGSVGGGSAAGAENADAVIIATLGQSALIKRLVDRGALDVTAISGLWEGFLVATVDAPAPGVRRALVIVGADRRGAIFGAHDLAERAGVSPWLWWADAPIPKRADLFAAPGVRTEAPVVRYRGIFLNDENPALYGWANATFGGFNHKFYERVFDLILRLKGNFLWPAMWGKAFYDDDPQNAALANEMGVIIGTSHHEPMARAHVEWERYGDGPWSYDRNAGTLDAFWRTGIRRLAGREAIVTIGMRGDGDEPMSPTTATAMLERIVRNQRRIIEEETGAPAEATPQVWALYKEVQDYYDKGMQVPDDVLLLFADDNWGNIRRLPSRGKTRAGGYGVYYHFDYVGGPRNYKWLNTNQVGRIFHQMSLAHRRGADRLWIVNVGDLKPMEAPMDFFLDLAWNPDAWSADRIASFNRQFATQQIGDRIGPEAGALLDRYETLAARRKPELVDADTYSLYAHDESARIAGLWRALADDADSVLKHVPAEASDAYAQLVWHPIMAMENLHALYRETALNRLHAAQGRVSANRHADAARKRFLRDAALSEFYHTQIADGKWVHMMDQTRIGYEGWQQPEENIMPATVRVTPLKGAAPAIAIGGDAYRFGDEKSGRAALPVSDSIGRQERTVEIFNRGDAPFFYRARTSAPWLKLSPSKGRVVESAALRAHIDWARVPAGESAASIVIEAAGQSLVVAVPVDRKAAPPENPGFVEADGMVVMPAVHCSAARSGDDAPFVRIPNLGREGASIAMPRADKGDDRWITFEFFTYSRGEATVELTFSPALDLENDGGTRVDVAIDDNPPRSLYLTGEDDLAAWEAMVARNADIVSFATGEAAAPGRHRLRIRARDEGVVLQQAAVHFRKPAPSFLGPPASPRLGRDMCAGLSAG